MTPVRIPRRVDEPPHILLWSADEMAPLMLGLIIGMLIEKALICTLAGLVVTKLYSRFRDNHQDGYLLHLIYKIGLLHTKAKTMANPFTKNFFP